MHDKLSHSPALSHWVRSHCFPTWASGPPISIGQNMVCTGRGTTCSFKCPLGNLIVRPPWIRGNYIIQIAFRSFPGGSDHIESTTCNVGYLGWISGSGRSPGEGHGNPLQCSCLENPMDRGAWWATVHGVEKSRTRLSD